MREEKASRRKYLRDCWKYSAQHWIVATAVTLVALYGFYTDFISPIVDFPALPFNIPRLPLLWALVVFLFGILFIVLEGGYRRLQNESDALSRAEAQVTTLEADNQQLLNERAADQILLEKADDHLQSLKRQLESRSLAAEWKELSDRFARGDPNTFADWHRQTDGSERWEIRGHWKVRECESLCKLAGAMLLRSPKVLSRLSDKLLNQNDHTTRWLDFLVESKSGRLEDMMHGQDTDAEGKQIGMLYLTASLHNLDGVSARACIECAAKET